MDNLLAALFTVFASVMVKIQPIWEKYKILISIVLGIAIGLIIGWGLFPVQWENATPGHLRADYRSYYLAYVADEYIRTGDTQLVRNKLGLDITGKTRFIPWLRDEELLPADIQTAIDGAGELWQLDPGHIIALQRLSQELPLITEVATAVPPETEASEAEGGIGSALLTILLYLLLVLAVVGLGFFLLRRLFAGRQAQEAGTDYAGAPSQVPAAEQPAHTFAGETAPPVKSFTTTYVLGDDYFDPSFSIEIENDFLGECGIGISETIGTGDPKKVTAFEAWLFDKSDIRTVTTVLASEYAYNDPDLRSKLAPKGDVELLRPDMEIVLETTALRVRAHIKALEYAQGNLPPNSFTQRLIVELQAWVKQGA